jgi:hypothetical protein
MDKFELQSVEAVKPGEAVESAQTRELDDATFEPSMRIEQTGDYKQSEAIQADFSAVVVNTAAASVENIASINTPALHDEGLPVKGRVAPKEDGELGIKIDPDTGQISGPSANSGGKTGMPVNDTAVMQETDAGLALGHTTDGIGNTPPRRMAPVDDRGEPTRMPIGPWISDEPPTIKGSGKGAAEGSKAPTGPENLADQHFADYALDALGYGMIGFKSGAKGGAHGIGAKGHAGQTMGGLTIDAEGESKGHSSSGGGAPAHGYGPGLKGEGSFFSWMQTSPGGQTDGGSGTSNDNCGSTTERMADAARGSAASGGSGAGIVSCGGNSGFTVSWGTKDGSPYVKVGTYGNTIDGGSPTPYTGNWSGGKYQPGDPGTIGGKNGENDSGRLMPVIRNSGMGYQGGGGGGNDSPSVWDDGNWYGGIFGGGDVYTDSGGALPIDPIPHNKV